LPYTLQGFSKACAKLLCATAVAVAEIKGFGKGLRELQKIGVNHSFALEKFLPSFFSKGWQGLGGNSKVVVRCPTPSKVFQRLARNFYARQLSLKSKVLEKVCANFKKF